MSSRFNDNVPSRKPRTRIGRVLTELASGAESEEETDATEGTRESAAEAITEDLLTPLRAGGDSGSEPAATGVAETERLAQAPIEPATASEPDPSPKGSPEASPSRATHGRERVAALRERLAATTHSRTSVAEPSRTAAAVREVVEELRGRLEASIQERSELVSALEDARAQLTRTATELERERKLRTAAEALAEERAGIADDAVAEVEALAAERDQVLAELSEQRRLDDEQAALLVEVEATLAMREKERAAEAGELAELRDQLDARAVEVADLESRIQAEAAGRTKLEARCRELEGEVARLSDASEALEAIQAMIARRG